MNKNRLIKFTSIFLLFSFISFSSLQIKKTYTKAIAPAILLGYGVELLFSVAATAFIGNAVYEMGTEARKIYDDWQNKKDDDEKKAQYGYWGEKLKNSMTSEEVENALNSAVNVIDGAVGLTLSSKSYQEFIENVNKDRERNLSFSFSSPSVGYMYIDIACKNSKFKSKYDTLVSSNKPYFLTYNTSGDYIFVFCVSGSGNFINDSNILGFSNSNPVFASEIKKNSSSPDGFWSGAGNSGYFAKGKNLNSFSCFDHLNPFDSDFKAFKIVYEDGSVYDDSCKEPFETSQPDIEIKPNSNYDSEISVSIPTTEISSEQLTESPYKENASNFEYPDSFENVVNNTTINNEYNKNPIKEGNEGLLDYGDTVNLDFSPLYGAVEDKFPFCVPFDLFHAIDTLTAEKEKPEFTITFPSIATSEPVSFTFNFDDYELVIEIFRYFVLLAFCIGLVINTKKILGGS